MTDQFYMRQALRLARYGKGRVSPNPLVGAVIVKKSRIVGKGYHRIFGGDHAEISALKSAGDHAKGAVLYCTLEPCSHWGKTPPCVEEIIKAGIMRVVIGMVDPNPAVNGTGIKRLHESGMEVCVGVLEEECRHINASHIKYMSTGRPFITVKMAQTLDGKIARRINTRSQITGEASRRYVHRLRIENDAVLIGKRTAIIDNPLLMPRLVPGKMPQRVILDTHLESHPSLKIYDTANQSRVIVATASENRERIHLFEKKGVTLVQVKTGKNGLLRLPELLDTLGGLSISSVLIEGGASVFSSFLRERLVDRLILLVAPYLYGGGVDVIDKNNGAHFPVVKLEGIIRKSYGRDTMIAGTPHYE